jgi:hypothetical protein
MIERCRGARLEEAEPVQTVPMFWRALAYALLLQARGGPPHDGRVTVACTRLAKASLSGRSLGLQRQSA